MNATIKKYFISFSCGAFFTAVALFAIYFEFIKPRASEALRRARDSVSELTAQLSNLSKEADDLRKQLQTYIRDLDTANAGLAKRTAELTDLTKRLADAQTRAREYAISLEDLRKRYAESVARNTELNARIRELTDTISGYFDDLRRALDGLSSVDGSISSAIQGLREIITIIQGTIAGS